MIIRKSFLSRRAEHGHAERTRRDARHREAPHGLLDWLTRPISFGSKSLPSSELAELPLPDLLTAQPGSGPDPGPLAHLVDLAFLGRASAGEIDSELDALPVGETPWVPAHFADDLFLATLVETCLNVELAGQRFPAHGAFLEQVLSNPPTDVGSIRFRQEILRELEDRVPLKEAMDGLLARLYRLLSLLRASRDDARLEPVRFRLDVLQAFRGVVNQMADGFEGSVSGLGRLVETGEHIRGSAAFCNMSALLDHDAAMATLQLQVIIGANGRLRHLEVRGLEESRKNPFFRRPLRRWWDRLRILYHRYRLDADELVDRLVMEVYQGVAPAMVRTIQLLCHLEVYAASTSFAATARSRGLEVCLPELRPAAAPRFEGLFNPLLLALTERPVPSDITLDSRSSVMLVTGPNSGGKTRLLQAVGIAQALAQSGLFAPCSQAVLPVVPGLFASIVETDRADQSEGRLGTELVRLRTLFETVPPGSLVLLDELCSGTNPSEAIEIVDMVLRLLHQLQPVAFVTTHFLDFAQQMHARRSDNSCRFLHVEVDERQGATYRFIPGVASTSLAVGTAHRLGVTFEELEKRLEQRMAEVASTGDADPAGRDST